MKTAAIIFSLAVMADASCPNACSGNGICGAQDKCSCYQNWQGADCSARTCPSTLAWADTADGTNQAHYYAECGNKGICDRKSGECKCFDGYEGKGCRRSTCPEGCSGHGTCEYIEELASDFADRRNGPGNKYQDLTCTSQLDADAGTGRGRGTCTDDDGGTTCNVYNADSATCTANDDSGGTACIYTPHPNSGSCGTSGLVTTLVTARSANTDKHSGHQYNLWDAGKIQGCKCDLGYEGADCSTREVPRGDDPLTTVKATTMKQSIKLSGAAAGDQFFLNYYDPYGGKWTTNTITAVDAGTADGDVSHAKLIEDELSALPNEVLVGVKVKATTTTPSLCHRFYDGVQHISAYSESSDGNNKDSAGTTNFCKENGDAVSTAADDKIGVTVEFADSPGQTGVQYLLEVDTAASGAGSYPVSAGFAGAVTSTVAEINYNDNLGNLSELSSCSDRGLDNGDGECECFDGFRGLACEEQEALV